MMSDKEMIPMPSENIVQTFSERVRAARTMQGMTQETLAEKAGVSVDTIKRYESGKNLFPRLDFAYNIAKALGVSLHSMLPMQTEDTIDELITRIEQLIHILRQNKPEDGA